jgi:type IV secretion system protein TrbF
MKTDHAYWRPLEPAETPYKRAKQEWDRRMGAATVREANWRFAALALIALQLVSDIGILYLASQPKAIPHIVEVDKLGQPAYLGPLDRAAYRDFKPSTASIHYHLARFVRDTREITSDLAVLKRNWVDAYKLLTTNGSNFLNAYVQDHNPFQVVAAQVRVSLQINVVVQVSKDTWQVDWTETSTDEHGNPTETEVWRGTFHVLLRVPQNTEELAANPLGLFIDEIHWARLSNLTERTTP